MKINVVGTSGSGKSTLARKLAEKLAVPYLEMDRLYWRPGWQGTPDEAFLQRVAEALAGAGEGWVLDGNYTRTRAIKWREIDWVVWVDYSFGRTLFQAVRRAFWRAATRAELWPGTGNRESFRRSFFSRDSIILWTFRTYRQNRVKYLAEMAQADGNIRFIRLRSPRQAAAFLQDL
ncbi:topology modulation protein [Serratia entomophila]|jgi:energy-coupling factor transporter ATP-binding protein EcfA2|uniref:(d)CMP kinase n=1 Tax=Serratia entomophila TaxID=42906 RepID=UPI001F297999|nr:(d)CMP kinase [Serratia entomophila]UIW19805.1 (d)CMP kinase [Serratia entomophila]CAI0724137.1 topology modulation protein [Serratia entomophila]CAI0768323.1 topology modulation protein [Serratia entomophila]CAI0768329.1 topology modulation protein [Serratia entomophila]CAI0769271.1 topology modulation protein [Serratia entomophila]